MTTTEMNRFRAVLTARVAELERLTRQRDGITVERSADQLEEIQAASERALAVSNLDREFSQLRNARAALRRIRGRQLRDVPASAMKTSTRSGLPQCRGPHIVYGARKPSTAISEVIQMPGRDLLARAA